jgi:hypothetical protein
MLVCHRKVKPGSEAITAINSALVEGDKSDLKMFPIWVVFVQV